MQGHSISLCFRSSQVVLIHHSNATAQLYLCFVWITLWSLQWYMEMCPKLRLQAGCYSWQTVSTRIHMTMQGTTNDKQRQWSCMTMYMASIRFGMAFISHYARQDWPVSCISAHSCDSLGGQGHLRRPMQQAAKTDKPVIYSSGHVHNG